MKISTQRRSAMRPNLWLIAGGIICSGFFVFNFLSFRVPIAKAATGTWNNISPAGVSTNFSDFDSQNYGFQTTVVDPKNPGTVYVGTTYQGLYKSTDNGNTWSRVDTTPNLFTGGRIWCLAIDNFNSNLYACDGYGIQQGVFKSTDGGVTWTEMMPSSLFQQTSADIYDITTDPYLANHILVTSHSGWNGGSDSGVLESFDGGATWTVHNPAGPWGSGHYIFFMNNSATWLLGTQEDGFWKTTNSGATWTQVDSIDSMQHGADQLYHSSVNDAWYLGAVGTLLRSTNTGSSWSPVGVSNRDGYNAVIGDGTNLYAQSANTGVNSTGPNTYITSPESDGVNWTTYNSQTFTDGPMSMAYDPVNHYLYSSNWDAGIWRLSTGVPDTTPPTVAITSPANNANVTASIAITTNATDNVAVAGVQFKLDGNNLGTEITTAPYSISWNTTAASNGTHTLTAVAIDTSNNTATSVGVNVTVNNTPPQAAGTWANVSPGNADLIDNLDCGNFGTTSMLADPAQPSNLYTEFNCQGIWKSTDYGVTWTGPINTGTNGAIAGDCAGGLSIAPGNGINPPTLYEACIRGNAISQTGWGFWKSTDGGVSWTNYAIAPTPGHGDYYPPAVDPNDGNHLIMAAHEFNALVQSTDGGQTWTSINMNPGMNEDGGTAAIFFINTGNATSTRNTWLYIAQGSSGTVGTWRTTNGGTSWTQVDTNEHPHGNSQIYQPDNNGVVYMAGVYSNLGWGVLRSTNYGQTWALVGSSGSMANVFGTPNNVYSDYSWACGNCTVNPSLQSAPQPGITGWTAMTTPTGMNMGPAQTTTVYNGTNYIIMGADWQSGLWRYVEPAAGVPPAFNFSLSNVGDVSMLQGASATNNVNAILTSGTSQPVSLQVTGLPAGASASFSLASCSPTCTSVLTINTIASTPQGSSVITVTATSGSINQTTTFNLNITSPPPPDTIPPTVSIFSPTSGSGISGTISAVATASDNVAVAGVQFQLDGNNLGSLITAAPYSINWDTSTTTNGTHTLTAIATDTSNNSTISASVSVTVNNIPATGFDFSLGNSGDQNVISGSTVTNSITASLTSSPSATTYIQDSFTGTNGTALTAHTPDIGGAWIGDQGSLTIQGNQTQGVAFGATWMHNAATPASADYEVSADILWSGAAGSSLRAGVTGRVSGAHHDGYIAYYNESAGQWFLDKWVGYNLTNLGTFSQPYIQGQTHNLKLGMAGATITLYVDGISRISVSDSSISVINNAGIYIEGGYPATAIPVDNFLVTGTGGGIPTVGFTASGLPAGAVASFSPASCTPSCSSTMTITTTSATAAGMYPVTVTGIGSSVSHSTSFNLVVTVPLPPPPDTTPPSAPTNLTATAFSANQINLAWTPSTDNVGVTGYTIFRNNTQIATTQAASFSDTGLSSGITYTYTVSAFDAVGNNSALSTAASGMTFSPDTTAPSIPTGLQFGSSTLNQIIFSWTASTDNVGVTGYQIFRNNTLLGTTAATSYTDTGLAMNTSYSYTLTAFDAVGNKSATSQPLVASTQADTTAPTISITAPANNATVSGLISITANASDNVAVASVQFQLNGNNLGSLITVSPYTVNWDTTTVTNGVYSITAIAKDTSNNTASSTVSVTVNNIVAPPFDFSLTNGGAKSVTAGSAVTNSVTATITQGVGATTYVQDSFTGTDGTLLTSHTPDVGGTWTYDCCGSATLLGNKLQGDPWVYTVMNNSTVPTSTDYQVSMDVTFNAVSGNGATMGVMGRSVANTDGYRAFYDDSAQQWKLDSRSQNAEINIGTYAQPYVQGQTHNIKLSMVGTAISVSIDGVVRISATDSRVTGVGHPGIITSSYGNSAEMLGDNYLATGSTPAPAVNFTASGLPAGATASFAPGSCSPTCTTTLTINTSTSTPIVTSTITITGTSGTTMHTTTFGLTVNPPPPDTTPPTVALSAPANNATVSGNATTVSATAADNVGVVGVQFKLDGVNLSLEVTTAPYSIVWNTVTATNGTHTLTAVARDAAGNKTTSAARTVTVNNDITPPTVSISAPTNNASVVGTVTVSATAADNIKVVGVQFKLDGANLGAEDTTSPYSVSWVTTTATNGTHTLTAVARDAAGNMTTATIVSVKVANPITFFPQSYLVNQGSFVSGTTASLTADDNNYLVIASTTTGTNRQTNTDFTLVGVAPSSTLAYTVRLKSSVATTTAVILAFNYTTSTWTQLSSTSIGTSEVTIANSITTGAANYVNPQGNVLLEVQSTKTANNTISDEIVQLVATP